MKEGREAENERIQRDEDTERAESNGCGGEDVQEKE